MLTKKLEEEGLNKKATLYPRPANCSEIVTPLVNPEIWNKVFKETTSKDIKLQKTQSANVKGLGALAKLASTLLEARTKKTAVPVDDCLKMCLDAFALFSSGNQELNNRRKELIKSDLNFQFKDLAKNNPVTTMLFRDDLSQQVKDINESDKMAKYMAKGSSKFNFAKGKSSFHSQQSKNWSGHRRSNNGGYNGGYNNRRKFPAQNGNRQNQGTGKWNNKNQSHK